MMMYLNSRSLSIAHATTLFVGLVLAVPGTLSCAFKADAQEVSNTTEVQTDEPHTNDVVIELFYRSDSDQSLNAEKFLRELATRRPGFKIKTYDVLKDRAQLTRLWELSKKFGHEKATVPSFFFCNRFKVGFHDPRIHGPQIEELFNIKAYVRPGCKHCQAGKEFLDKLVVRWPALKVRYFDVVNDAESRAAAERLTEQYHVRVPSFPCIQVAGRLVVGYQSDEITGKQIEDLFQDLSVDLTPKEVPENKQPANTKTETSDKNEEQSRQTDSHSSFKRSRLTTPNFFLPQVLSSGFITIPDKTVLDKTVLDEDFSVDQQDVLLPEDAQLPEDAALPDDSPLPRDADEQTVISETILPDEEPDAIEVPWLGRLSVSRLGLPAFTFLIGLIDGFNPCAMWVLIFLLSILVNLKDRGKILLVAGTFVVISGLAYFVFMAAWFNVFQFIGLLRPVQIGLAIVAIIVGSINIKDFFAFHKGVTLSIPDSAKPGIYRRVRKIVTANRLSTALLGAIVLAVIVNVVELLCTAGLPALYTEILTIQNLPTWVNYSYLALYICAYMLDDTILVAIVVVTMSHRRLQESEGRWLKLLSGVVILLLGIVMLFWPGILI